MEYECSILFLLREHTLTFRCTMRIDEIGVNEPDNITRRLGTLLGDLAWQMGEQFSVTSGPRIITLDPALVAVNH